MRISSQENHGEVETVQDNATNLANITDQAPHPASFVVKVRTGEKPNADPNGD